MKCNDLSKILPELAAGELKEPAAEEAREHIKTCQKCVAEYAGYLKAMSALARHHEMISVPSALDNLALPELRRPALSRPLIATVDLFHFRHFVPL